MLNESLNLNKIRIIFCFVSFIFLLPSCGESEDTNTSQNNDKIIENLKTWQRHNEPVLRDPEPDGGYEVAADPHVFSTEDGKAWNGIYRPSHY